MFGSAIVDVGARRARVRSIRRPLTFAQVAQNAGGGSGAGREIERRLLLG